MDKKYVWYACYGSNLLYERFILYIKGGFSSFNGRTYAGCSDKSLPLEARPISIPYKLYFGNYSKSWGGGGVAFLQPEINPKAGTLGRMYLITEEQFYQIQKAEGSVWYDLLLDLGTYDGIPVKTFTHSTYFPKNFPGTIYLQVIEQGLKETYPSISEEDLARYLKPYKKIPQ